MDPVNGVGQIVQILRKKLGDRKVAQPSSDASSEKTSSARKASAEDIRRKIGTRIRTLDPDEHQGRKAAQIFVESIIAWEFGDEVLQDPKFAELATEVTDSVLHNEKAATQLKTLLGQLR